MERFPMFYPVDITLPRSVYSVYPESFPVTNNSDYFSRVVLVDIPKCLSLPVCRGPRYVEESLLQARKEEHIWNMLQIKDHDFNIFSKKLIIAPDTLYDRAVITYETVTGAEDAVSRYCRTVNYPSVCAIIASDLLKNIGKWEKKIASTSVINRQDQLLYFTSEYTPRDFGTFTAYLQGMLSFAGVTRYSLHFARQNYHEGPVREVFIQFACLTDALRLEIYVDGSSMSNEGKLFARNIRNPVLVQHDLRMRKNQAKKHRDKIFEMMINITDEQYLPQVGCCNFRCRACGNSSIKSRSAYVVDQVFIQGPQALPSIQEEAH